MLQRRRWVPTISFFPILYFLGWLVTLPLFLLPNIFDSNDIALLSTTFTLLFFLMSLPSWLRFRWRENDTYFALGLDGVRRRFFIKSFLRGLILALCLIVFILIPILFSPWGQWKVEINSSDIMNSILLGLLVGFSEELIFRGWLWGELNFLLRPSLGFVIQAVIFSFVHVFGIIKSDIGFVEFISLLLGLFFLGLILALRRVLDRGSLGGCIGLHGGLVGIWFFINADLIDIAKGTPTWLIGPGEASPNPLGSSLGIVCLALILISYRNAFAIAGFPLKGERNASPKGDIP